MIAILRILMKDINIAAATALQAIDPLGREKAVKVGANIIMPNITPGKFRNDYALYENKPCVDEEPEECKNCLDVRIQLADGEIGYGEWGDSKHFHKRLTASDPAHQPISLVGRRDPATSQGLVKVNVGRNMSPFYSRCFQFCIEEGTLSIQHLQVSCLSAIIPGP